MNYPEFLKSKESHVIESGFHVKKSQINQKLFQFQQDITQWAVHRGKAAIWADCGLGKTAIQLQWAHQINIHRTKYILIIAPLSVSHQTIQEGKKFDVPVMLATCQEDILSPGIYITNYEKIHKFDLDSFSGIVFDESSIIKNKSGKYRNELIEKTKGIPFKLCCTATPSPNDFTELGNHAELLEICTMSEMQANFFIHDGGDTSKWRLRRHGEKKFWEWLTQWAVMLRKPSDLGYEDDGFSLPKLSIYEHIVKQDTPTEGFLFMVEAKTLTERRQARKASLEKRCQLAAKIVNQRIIDLPQNPFSVVWCNLNAESTRLKQLIPDSVEITGSMPDAQKTENMRKFLDQESPILISKPSICGFGLNLQHCAQAVFVGLSDSYEQYYQALRRIWRFGQKHEVSGHIVIADAEGAVIKNIQRKERDAERLYTSMLNNMKDLSKQQLHQKGEKKMEKTWERPVIETNYQLYHGDCVEITKKLNDNSIDYSIFSPPFAELYTYSDSIRDMGNARNYDEFFVHFKFLVKELRRVMKPGRVVSIHCMDIPAMKERDGYIGLKDFPHQIVDVFEQHDFIFHSRHIIWKDPLIEATRTKAIGLLHKQLIKDSTRCRAGIPDQLITMRMPGDNEFPVTHQKGLNHYAGTEDLGFLHGEKRSHLIWRKYASPVWMDIRQTYTLNKPQKGKDEKHICPLQLDTVERGIILYSNPGDRVFDPFSGIGTVPYKAVALERIGIGIELKPEYYRAGIANVEKALQDRLTLF